MRDFSIKSIKFVLILLLLTPLTPRAWAEECPEDDPTRLPDILESTNLFPMIDVNSDFWGTSYFINGELVKDNKILEETVLSVGDPDATRLIQSSQDNASIGSIILISSLGVGVTGFLISLSTDNKDPAGGNLMLGGAAFCLAGGFFYQLSRNDIHDAVQRYDQVIPEKNGVSLLYMPAHQQAGLAFVQRF
jgi:hypothetical protein